MLTLYRRHLHACPHATKGREHKRCHCPVWVSGTILGMPVRESLKTQSWEEGERRLLEMREHPAFQLPGPRTLAEAVRLFLDDASQGMRFAPDTIQQKKAVLLPLIEFCEQRGKTFLKQVTFEDLSEYRALWKYAPSSTAVKLGRLKRFFRFCVEARWISESPATHLRRPKVPPSATLPFTREQMTQILAASERYKDYPGKREANAKRLKALLLVLRYTGLRISDAVMLEDAQLEEGRIFLYRQQKTGEPVYVPIPAFVHQALTPLPGRTSKQYFFWNGTSKLRSAIGLWQATLERLFRFAGITHIPAEGVAPRRWQRRLLKDGRPVRAHAHMFRDTFAVELLLSGVPMEDVQILLGHTSIKTTEKAYAPWVKARQERLEEHIRKAWGTGAGVGTQDVHGKGLCS